MARLASVGASAGEPDIGGSAKGGCAHVEPSSPNLWRLTFAALAIVYLSWFASFGRFPVFDEIAFKAPGLHLASGSGFRAPELRHFSVPLEVSTAEIYGLQPPIYPLVFAGWTALFGFGWRQVFLFDAVIHVILCGLVAALTRCWYCSRGSAGWIAATMLLPIGTAGRPDELAMCFVIAAFISLTHGNCRPSSSVLAGVLGAMAAVTSPGCVLSIAGIVGGLITMRIVARRMRVAPVLIAAGSSVVLLALLLGLATWYWPRAIAQFTEHAASLKHHASVLTRAQHWIRFAPACLWVGFAVVFFGSCVGLVSLFKHEWSRAVTAAVFPFGILFAAAISHSPFYICFPLSLASAVLAAEVACFARGVRVALVSTAVALSLVGMIPGVLDAAALAVMPPDQRFPATEARLRGIIPPGATVVADEHWLTLGQYADVLDAGFPTVAMIEHADYVVMTANRSGAPGRRRNLPPALETELARAFRPIDENLARGRLALLGIPLSRSSRGFGAAVYQRIRGLATSSSTD